MKKIFFILISLISLSACVMPASPNNDESKYQFANLEEVDSFLYRQVRGWQAIDARSLIINISPSESYLLILERNLRAIKYTEGIEISSVNSRVRANLDLVHILDQDVKVRPSRIETIYKLPSRAARQNARAIILGKEVDASGEII